MIEVTSCALLKIYFRSEVARKIVNLAVWYGM